MPSKSKKQHNFMEMIAHSSKMAKKAGVPQSVGKDFAAADKGKKFNKGGEMAKKSDLKKMFKGKETKGEELKEAKAIKSGKITPEEYASGEKSEGVHKMKDGGSCYKEGGPVKKSPLSAMQKATPHRAMQTKLTTAEKAGKRAAAMQKVKGRQDQMVAKRAASMQKVQEMKGKQQAAKQARPAQPAASRLQSSDRQMKLRPNAMQGTKDTQQSPTQPMSGSTNMAASPDAMMKKMKKGGAIKSGIDGVAKRGKTKCMKNGGFVRAADGCATKGKTKGRFI